MLGWDCDGYSTFAMSYIRKFLHMLQADELVHAGRGWVGGAGVGQLERALP
jgi:hypothetical protein